ncbi:putative amidohydrolase [Streptosporangium lutulentum]|uniref:Amidohydrolase n=1 Tax=Streptosporangium lutulentum TaxID=1461250 RepID=A0ABT9QF23_9ACTN|nr:nitrilase-related carbon-nitrogen hydrolase [Streptosporangium lutulentum]MDP9845363.1 putative amidohydrolase [Streptosporangium lutulentum]
MSLTSVACCQLALAVGDPDGNRAVARRAVERAAAAGARVVILPELTNSGYVFRDRAEAAGLAEPLDGPTVEGWIASARRHGLILVGGLCERDEDGLIRNSAVLVDAGGVRAVYRKTHLWDLEKTVFTPGDELPPVVDTAVGRIGLLVCYDLKFPEWVRTVGLRGADLLCVPTNWPLSPRPAGERPAEVTRVQASASVNRMFVAACDRAGPERGVAWVGGSVVADPDGFLLAGPRPAYDEGLVIAECRLGDARSKRVGAHNDVHADRRPELYRSILEPARSADPAEV